MYNNEQTNNSRFYKALIYSFLIILLLLFISIFLYNKSSYSKISNIYIYGNEITDKKTIEDMAAIKVNDKIYKLRVKKIEDNIKLINSVKDVTVNFKFPNIVTIDIIEKKISFYLYNGNQIEAVLEDGFVLKNSGDFIHYIQRPIISTGLSDKEKYYFAKSMANIPENSLRSLSEIILLDNSELVVFTNDGYELRMFYEEFYEKMITFDNINDIIEANEGKKGIINLYEAVWFIPYDDYNLILHE